MPSRCRESGAVVTTYTTTPPDHWFQELDACTEPDFVLLGLIADDLELRGHPDAEAYRWCWKRAKWPCYFIRSCTWWIDKVVGNYPETIMIPRPIYDRVEEFFYRSFSTCIAALTPAFARCRKDGIDPWKL